MKKKRERDNNQENNMIEVNQNSGNIVDCQGVEYFIENC